MFTLKLFRSHPGVRLTTKVVAAHHVVSMTIGSRDAAMELWVFHGPEPSAYDVYYIGETEPGMEAHDQEGRHLEIGANSWWGWGLLENWEGNTSEHYRPAGYGHIRHVA